MDHVTVSDHLGYTRLISAELISFGSLTSVVTWQLGWGLAGVGWLRTLWAVGWISARWWRVAEAHVSSFIRQVWACSRGDRILRASGNMQGLLRSTLGTGTMSPLSYSVGQGKSWGQARFKMWENEPCLLMGGSAVFHCSEYEYKGGRELEPFYSIILPCPLMLHKSPHRSESFLTCKNGKESNGNF